VKLRNESVRCLIKEGRIAVSGFIALIRAMRLEADSDSDSANESGISIFSISCYNLHSILFLLIFRLRLQFFSANILLLCFEFIHHGFCWC
jgi:hypothetical protein